MNRELIKCESNKALAKHIIYGNEKNPHEIALEIMNLLI